MLRRLSRVTGGSSSSLSSGPSGHLTEPHVQVFLRMSKPYPGDNFNGLVHLHLPTDSEVILVEVVVVGKERARIGVLAGSANFEMRHTTYYQQYITVLGSVPPAVIEARRKAAAASQVNREDGGTNTSTTEHQRRRAMQRGSMNKQASMRAIHTRNNNEASNAATGPNEGQSSGEFDVDDGSSEQQTLLYAPTTVNEDQVVRLAAGTYTFPFHTRLPDVLPPSGSIVKGREGVCDMRYKVKTRVLLRSGKQLHTEVPFTVCMLPVQLQRWLQLHRPVNAPRRFPVPLLAPNAVAQPRTGREKRNTNTNAAAGANGSNASGGHSAGNRSSQQKREGGTGTQPGAARPSDDMPSTVTTDEAGYEEGEESDTIPDYDRGLGDVNEDDDNTSVAVGGTASGKSRNHSSNTAEEEYERTQRRCIDHTIHFSRAQLAKDEAECLAAAEERAKRQEKAAAHRKGETNAEGSSGSSSNNNSENASDADSGEEDRVFVIGADANADAKDKMKRTKGKGQTRMVTSEIDKIGFTPQSAAGEAAEDETEEHAAADEQQRRHYHRGREHAKEGGEREHGVNSTTPNVAGRTSKPKDGVGSGADGKTALGRRKVTDDAGSAAVPEIDGSSVAPPSRTLREPIWEQDFIMPLRCGVISKGTVGLQLILHANVLRIGKDKVRFSAIVDNTQGGGPITKVRYSLVVRQMIRSKSETYPFTRVEAEGTATTVVAKGKIARLPLMELAVPASVPPTVFTEGGYSSTFLNIRIYTSSALKTYSRSVEIELLAVSAVDTENRSRRLLRWTNYFVGRGLKPGAESSPTIDLNSTNLHPKVVDAAAIVDAEDEAAADIAESVMGDRYTASILAGPSVTSRAPTTVTGAATRPRERLSPSSTAVLLSQHALEASRGKQSGKRSKQGAKQGSPLLAAKVRTRLNFDEPTYLPLAAAATLAGGGGPAVHADPMSGMNPLAARRPGWDLDVYRDEE